jgi:lipoprotein-anchoring transpeptidase ErfK/SrfK
MRTLRAVIWVALATGLTFVVGEASAQYYPSGPAYPAPRMGPPMPVDADDGPDYAPPPPPYYGPRPPAAVYPGPPPEPYGQRQAYPAPPPEPYGQRQAYPAPPAPAAGTNFPPPAEYPWVRERGGYAAAPPAPGPGGPYPSQGGPYPQSGHIMSDQPDVPRPPAQVDTGVTGSVNPNANVASLPADIRPEEGSPAQLPPQFRRQVVAYQTNEPAGTIIIDTPNTYLYFVLGHGQAMRYGVGVGRDGFTWTGTEKISKMTQWPDWFPPKEMIERQPYLPRFMAGGPSNPLGARALYLGKTLYRIHGTNQPSTIGSFVSSGCIRLVNEDIEDLFTRVQVGTRVVVLPGANQTPSAAATGPTAVR